MSRACVEAVCGHRPLDRIIRHVRIVNVFNDSVTEGCIGLVGTHIAYAGPEEDAPQAVEELDGGGRFALPGFVDAHMHLESSMLTPANFARTVLARGTTTVAADPHEIGNVLGYEGVRALVDASANLPLRVLVMAPSTIPSAPGFEDSGWAVGPAEMERLLDLPGIHGLGEVMDFNGVADGEANILSVVETAARRGCLLDGHASVLTGRRLQAFRAAGIDSDHTVSTPEKLREELALGFSVQVQLSMLTEDMVRAMNEAPLQNRICLVTDDVSLPRLMHQGHLNHVVARAVALGMPPLQAIRFATINPAERLRLYDVGAVAPGRRADIQLVEDLAAPSPSLVLCGGEIVVQDGRFAAALPDRPLAQVLGHSLRCPPVTEETFAVTCPVAADFSGGTAVVNVIHQNGVSLRTSRVQRELPLRFAGAGMAAADTAGLCRMAVINRYGKNQRGLALLDGLENFSGAVALTYGHDSHNLTVYGSNAADMAAAANGVIGAQGGICAASDGRVTALIPLPLAGLMCEEPPEALLAKLDGFLAECRRMGFVHADPMAFFTIMPLAVSPEIKCTDRGLLDVVHKQFLPLIQEVRRLRP